MLVAVACSGASGNDDLFEGSVFDPGSSGGTSTSSSSSGGSGSSSGGSTSSTSGSSSGSHDAHDAGKKDAGVPVPVVDATVPPDPGIFCGTGTSCPIVTDVCCATPGATFMCQSAAVQCAGTPIACDDMADCGGLICCGRFNANDGYRSVECRPTCTGQLDGDTLVRFCDPTAATDECASIGKSCKASGSLIGYFRCE
jgi:hypothetical protein